MAELARVVRLGQEEVGLPSAIFCILIDVILAVFPCLCGVYTFLHSPVVGAHVHHRTTPAQHQAQLSKHCNAETVWTVEEPDNEARWQVLICVCIAAPELVRVEANHAE